MVSMSPRGSRRFRGSLSVQNKGSSQRGRRRAGPDAEVSEARKASFAEQLSFFLEAFGVSNSQVVDVLEVKAPTVSQWRAGHKLPTRPHVIELARVLDSARKEMGGTVATEYDLGTILISLLQSGGWSVDAKPRDIAFDRLRGDGPASSGIRIGWTPCAPLAFSGGPGPQGLAIEIARRCVRLMGLKAEFVSAQDWVELYALLRERRIDMIAPIVAQSPSVGRDIDVSENIGLFLCHFLVVSKAIEPDKETHDRRIPVRETGDQFFTPPQRGPVKTEKVADRFENLMYYSVRGGVASDIFVEGNDFIHYSRVFESESDMLREFELRRGVIDSGNRQGERYIAITADWQAALRLQRQMDWVRVYAPYEYVEINMPLCFALHVDEPRLLKDVNTVIRSMRESGALSALLGRYRSKGDYAGYKIDQHLPDPPSYVGDDRSIRKRGNR